MKILIEPNKNELNNSDINLSVQKAKDLSQIYSRTFTSKDGIMILEDLARMSGMYNSNFVPADPLHTAFLEGRRALLLYICSQIENNINNIEGNN